MFARQRLSSATLDTLALVADSIAQGIERKRTEEALRKAQGGAGSCHAGDDHGRIDGLHCPRSQPAARSHRHQRQCLSALAGGRSTKPR